MAPFGRRNADWEPWFEHCTLLPSSGFLPNDHAASHVSPPCDVIARWGAKQSDGYAFRECDVEEYYLYVSELFQHVHQRPMVNRSFPLHFARGLLEEGKGNPVDWTSFAMLRCFPAARKRPFHLWGPYEHVRRPLPWQHPKCLPAGSRPVNENLRETNTPVSPVSLN